MVVSSKNIRQLSFWNAITPEFAIDKKVNLHDSNPGFFITNFMIYGALGLYMTFGFSYSLMFLSGIVASIRYLPPLYINMACVILLQYLKDGLRIILDALKTQHEKYDEFAVWNEMIALLTSFRSKICSRYHQIKRSIRTEQWERNKIKYHPKKDVRQVNLEMNDTMNQAKESLNSLLQQ